MTGDERAVGAQTTRAADGLTTLALFRRVCGSATSLVWVPLVRAVDLLPGLRDEMVRRLHYPVAGFEPFDEELGWVYVNVPIDVRTEAASWEPIVLSASVEGPPGLAPWVTMTATPVALLFVSGDPMDAGVVVRCEGDAPVAAYVAAVPGVCSYTWRNASTTVAGDVFAAEMGIVWDVTYVSSDGPGSLDVDPTVTAVPVRVAEIKALVTCTGPDPAQGGC